MSVIPEGALLNWERTFTAPRSDRVWMFATLEEDPLILSQAVPSSYRRDAAALAQFAFSYKEPVQLRPEWGVVVDALSAKPHPNLKTLALLARKLNQTTSPLFGVETIAPLWICRFVALMREYNGARFLERKVTLENRADFVGTWTSWSGRPVLRWGPLALELNLEIDGDRHGRPATWGLKLRRNKRSRWRRATFAPVFSRSLAEAVQHSFALAVRLSSRWYEHAEMEPTLRWLED